MKAVAGYGPYLVDGEVTAESYGFGAFRLNVLSRQLWRDNEPIALTPKALDVLLSLVSRCDRVVEKADLLRIAWPDAFVSEENLTQCIWVLRKALDDNS